MTSTRPPSAKTIGKMAASDCFDDAPSPRTGGDLTITRFVLNHQRRYSTSTDHVVPTLTQAARIAAKYRDGYYSAEAR